MYVKKIKSAGCISVFFILGGFCYASIYSQTWKLYGTNKEKQGIQNIALTDSGREQALRLGKYLEGKSIKHIYSNDLNAPLKQLNYR